MAVAESPSLETILDALGETLDSFQDLLGRAVAGGLAQAHGLPGLGRAGRREPHRRRRSRAGRPAEGAGDEDRSVPAAGQAVREDTNRTIAADVESRRSRTPAELREEFAEVRRPRWHAAGRATAVPRDHRRPVRWKLPYDRLLSIRTFDVVAHEQDVRRRSGGPATSTAEAATLVEGLRLRGAERHDRRTGAGPRRPPGEDRGHRPAKRSSSAHEARRGQAAAAPPQADTDTGRDQLASGQRRRTIRMPFSELIAFACGRADVAHTKLVTIDGDKAARRAGARTDGLHPLNVRASSAGRPDGPPPAGETAAAAAKLERPPEVARADPRRSRGPCSGGSDRRSAPGHARSAGSTCRWVVEAGWVTSVWVPPREAPIQANSSASHQRRRSFGAAGELEGEHPPEGARRNSLAARPW